MRTVAICGSKKYKDQIHQFSFELERKVATTAEELVRLL